MVKAKVSTGVKRRKHIHVLRSENRIVLDPTTKRVRRLLRPQLSYVEKVFYRGQEAQQRRHLDLPLIENVEWQCYGFDIKKRLASSYGFYERIARTLRVDGYKVSLHWSTQGEYELATKRDSRVFTPDWTRIEELIRRGFRYRHGQKDVVKLFAEFENGRINCPTGWGKGTVIMLCCMLFPRAKIGVVSKNSAVLDQRIWPELAANLPSVGRIGGGHNRPGRRVTCYNADSLHRAPDDLDILLIDEGHQACADKFAQSLIRFQNARIWMFSASWDMRLDNKDLRAEALAGPVRIEITYQEAVDHGLIVPIEVIWHDVVMDVNPASDLVDEEKLRAAYWANDYRNELIAEAAHLYDDDVQVLIPVTTLEHALYLKQLLPEFEVVWADRPLKPRDVKWFRRQGLLYDGWKPMTRERKERLTRRFSKGKLKKVIATPVWNVGVSFNHLQVLIRADGGGSPINDTQIPGRTSRLGKHCGILHDFRDQFDEGSSRKAARREGSYEVHGWKQHYPNKRERRSLLKRLLEGKVTR